jgi:hypothetical protein
VLGGHSGKGSRLARLHVDATEVDRAAEGALNGGLEEIELAHGDAAASYDHINASESGAKRFLQGSGSAVLSAFISPRELGIR